MSRPRVKQNRIATRWANGRYYYSIFHPPEIVENHFTEALAKPWEQRLVEYRAWTAEIEAQLYTIAEMESFKSHLGLDVDLEQRPGDDAQQRRLKQWALNRMLRFERNRRIGSEFHGFLNLPRELRDMIYTFALAGDHLIFNHADVDWTNAPRISLDHPAYSRYMFDPDLVNHLAFGLVSGVSRSVDEEARPIFYTKNLFYLLPGGETRFLSVCANRVEVSTTPRNPTDYIAVIRNALVDSSQDHDCLALSQIASALLASRILRTSLDNLIIVVNYKYWQAMEFLEQVLGDPERYTVRPPLRVTIRGEISAHLRTRIMDLVAALTSTEVRIEYAPPRRYYH